MTMATAPPKHVKVTMYMPPAMLADLDLVRVGLLREGESVDRGQLIRAAITVASANPGAWTKALKESE